MTRRKLSRTEKRRIAEERRIQEMKAHPDKMIAVRVGGEADENGKPVVLVHFVGERQSKNWKRSA